MTSARSAQRSLDKLDRIGLNARPGDTVGLKVIRENVNALKIDKVRLNVLSFLRVFARRELLPLYRATVWTWDHKPYFSYDDRRAKRVRYSETGGAKAPEISVSASISDDGTIVDGAPGFYPNERSREGNLTISEIWWMVDRGTRTHTVEPIGDDHNLIFGSYRFPRTSAGSLQSGMSFRGMVLSKKSTQPKGITPRDFNGQIYKRVQRSFIIGLEKAIVDGLRAAADK